MTKAATQTVDFGDLDSEDANIPQISDLTVKGILVGVSVHGGQMDPPLFPPMGS